MNVNRLIWIFTTILFACIGFLLGLSLGRLYVDYTGTTTNAASGHAIAGTLAVAGAIVVARFGSWLSDRHLIGSLSRVQKVSAADRVLGIGGVLLGIIFSVLVTIPLPNTPLWLPIKLCAMAVSAGCGMALLLGMREEMLHVFPRLNETTHGAGRAGSSMPKLIDTNIIIDGRMVDICKTGFIEGPLLVPSFVLEEVQYIADSSDSLKRARGRRGLDVLNAMRELRAPFSPNANAADVPLLLQVLTEIPSSVRRLSSVDSKLVGLAKELGAVIVTNDYNLNRVAELQGVKVLNINELVQALKPVVLPGEEMNITISREGKEPGQGVGYLDDGTMVVVSDARRHIGETCKISISSVIQTVAGKMIFAEMREHSKEIKGSGDDLFDDSSRRTTNGNGQSGDDSGYRSGGGLRRKNRP
jgi:uncharacterized protein YacL